MKSEFKESDLYLPIKNYFMNLGYEVYGEVLSCDVVAIKGDKTIMIELKKQFCLQVLYQALERQVYTDNVFIAIPQKKGGKRKEEGKQRKLLKKLNIGLLRVALDTVQNNVVCELQPSEEKIKKNKHSRKLMKEVGGRSGDFNTGGATGKKIMTAYREETLKIAVVLQKEGALSARQLIKNFQCSKRANMILYQNHYQWFDRVTRGIYTLSVTGHHALEEKDTREFIKIVFEQSLLCYNEAPE